MDNYMAKITQTAGRDKLGDFAPEFAHFNDDILFGENWNNQDIDLKTRSIIVISVFMGRGLADSSLLYHLQTAKKHGVTKKEIAAIITHAGFYAGWPMAWAVFNMAKEVWTEEEPALTDKDQFQQECFFEIGEVNPWNRYFTGISYLHTVSDEQLNAINVTFEPGCRNFWHTHHAKTGGGQMLIGVAGEGWYQEWGKDPVKILPGTVIHIPAGVKHWHGASKDSWFSHLAFELAGEETSNQWQEPVDDAHYDAVNQ